MYAELQIVSNFSFLEGASHPEEYIVRANALGLKAIAITDRNTLAGVVRAHKAAREHGVAFIPACRLDLLDGPSLLVYPTDRDAYARLTHLLTIGNRRAKKGSCHLFLDDVAAHSKGLIVAVIPDMENLADALIRVKERLDASLYLAASHTYRGQDQRQINILSDAAKHFGLSLLATGDVAFHAPERRMLADVMACVREHKRLDAAGYLVNANAERFIKPGQEMARLFADHPQAIRNTLALAEACSFSLDELRYNYPNEPVPKGITPQEHLVIESHKGMKRRYPEGIPAKVKTTMQRELALIGEMKIAPYFLTVHDIVSYAKRHDILCQGRGSAANSVVCYALGITDVNPDQVDLLFERFVSKERGEPPDIDVDFEHERREEVIQYIYRRYGRHRAGLAATLITYRSRSAVRDVGRVMGLSEDTIGALAATVWGHYGGDIEDDHVKEKGFDPSDRRLRQTLDLAHQLVGFPRHLSQHVGGFVLTESPLHEIVPIQNAAMKDRTVIEWNKDDLETLDILKVDILSLGMLTCIRKAFDLIRYHHRLDYTLASIPKEDEATYAMLRRADTIGVFQVESRAQMSMLPRLKPREYYDLVVQVAIVRPGPIQGNMVHPYLKRRQGKEPVSFPSPAKEHGPEDELEEVLRRTYGVPLFQEQAMKIAIVAAGFTPGEADRLRRSMASFRNTGTIWQFEEKFINGMVHRGYEQEFAERCFEQIKGFADYGFPESHAASFALLAYASSWLKCYYPHIFACALLNSQPMGFYAPAQIVRDAREHGVEVRPVDVNKSSSDNLLEPAPDNEWGFAIRLGMRQVKGIKQETAIALLDRRTRPYRDVEELHERTRIAVSQLESLAEADAFRSCGLDRRAALWQVRGLADTPDLPLFMHADISEHGKEMTVCLPEMALSEHVVNDYQMLRLSLKAHPLSFLRGMLEASYGAITNKALDQRKDGARVTLAGLVLVRQRPGSAKGVIFLTIEDETGVANLVVWKDIFERRRAVIMGSRLVIVRGRLQREEGVTHIVVEDIEDASPHLLTLSEGGDVTQKMPNFRARTHPRNVRGLIPKSRDFH